jgi:hypothetical protein
MLNSFSKILVGYTARDSIVISPSYAGHQVIVLVLDRRSINRNFGAEVFESLRKFF